MVRLGVVVLALLVASSGEAALPEAGSGSQTASRPSGKPEVRASLIWPVKGPVISRFGSPRLWHSHRGVDIKAPQGALIHAAAAGTVVFSGRESSYGRTVKIAHSNGLSTVYAHNSANFVKSGDKVKTGAVIGAVGHTGHATTNHLHFEVRRQGVARNPLPLLPQPSAATTIAKHRAPHVLAARKTA
jgi:murein DD-endopeptidase MepM/ murein hydrolase activator NlpD